MILAAGDTLFTGTAGALVSDDLVSERPDPMCMCEGLIYIFRS